jgi:hypothetical protein
LQLHSSKFVFRLFALLWRELGYTAPDVGFDFVEVGLLPRAAPRRDAFSRSPRPNSSARPVRCDEVLVGMCVEQRAGCALDSAETSAHVLSLAE